VSPRLWLVAGVAAAGAVLIGLAGLLEVGPFADEELGEADFLARGDEICREAHKEFEDLQRRAPTTASEAAELTDSLVEISEGELEQIRDLNAPASLERSLQRYLDAREEAIEQLHKGSEAAEDRDAGAYADAQAKVASEQVHRQKLAKRVGFDQCSKVLFGRRGP
jgi:hypothetical protein